MADIYDEIAAAITAKNNGDNPGLDAHVAAIDQKLSDLQNAEAGDEASIAAIHTGLEKIAAAVTPPPPLAITMTSLPNGTVGAGYTASLSIAGGIAPYSVSSSPATDNGVTINSDGTVTGTPVAAADSSFAVTVTDSKGTTASATVTLHCA